MAWLRATTASHAARWPPRKLRRQASLVHQAQEHLVGGGLAIGAGQHRAHRHVDGVEVLRGRPPPARSARRRESDRPRPGRAGPGLTLPFRPPRSGATPPYRLASSTLGERTDDDPLTKSRRKNDAVDRRRSQTEGEPPAADQDARRPARRRRDGRRRAAAAAPPAPPPPPAPGRCPARTGEPARPSARPRPAWRTPPGRRRRWTAPVGAGPATIRPAASAPPAGRPAAPAPRTSPSTRPPSCGATRRPAPPAGCRPRPVSSVSSSATPVPSQRPTAVTKISAARALPATCDGSACSVSAVVARQVSPPEDALGDGRALVEPAAAIGARRAAR